MSTIEYTIYILLFIQTIMWNFENGYENLSTLNVDDDQLERLLNQSPAWTVTIARPWGSITWTVKIYTWLIQILWAENTTNDFFLLAPDGSHWTNVYSVNIEPNLTQIQNDSEWIPIIWSGPLFNQSWENLFVLTKNRWKAVDLNLWSEFSKILSDNTWK